MVWPVGELQVFYKVTSSCLWGRGGEGERQEGEREKRDLTTSHIRRSSFNF